MADEEPTEQAADGPSPFDQLVDLLVYAPVGMLYERDEVLPKLIKRGRSQVQLARVLGQLAVKRGQGTVESAIDDAVGVGASILSRAVSELSTALGLDEDDEAATARPEPASAPSEQHAPGAQPLPIAGYDELTAREVVGLVGELSASQRQRVREHEEANRGRKTVLAKLDQLDRSDR